MTKTQIPEGIRQQLLKFLKKHPKGDLITTYLFYLSKKFGIEPVIFPRDKLIYQSEKQLVEKLEKEGRLWRETEIKIQFGRENVNDQTKKIYICPFTGKVFGDNTHPNPQDAIYDWVSKCPENTERVGGLRSKRFFVSEDPDVIQNYIVKRKEPVTKVVYSSAITGKLFNSRAAVLDDFQKHHIKHLTLMEVPSQNRFQIEEGFLEFIQNHLQEQKIAEFIESLSAAEEFATYTEQWLEEEE